MPKYDQQVYDDPHAVAEFSQDIYLANLNEEKENMVDVDYLSKVQTEIKDTSRAFLLEWIVDVHRKFRLRPECLYVTAHIIAWWFIKDSITIWNSVCIDTLFSVI